MPHVLAIDEGTTGVRALILNGEGKVVATAYQELNASYPQAGWVECDAEHIWNSTLAVCRAALAQAGCQAADLSAIGITNQRSTVVAWDARSGKAVYPAIIWQDTRTAARVEELLQQGLFTNSMASAAKFEWIVRHAPGARELAAASQLRFGTVDSWLVWRLSEGRIHATDASNASCTTLYDHVTGGWDANALSLLDLAPESMPTIRASSEVYGMATALGGEIPIAGIAGDQQAAMFGEMGLTKGSVKATFGTSGMFDINVGDFPVFSTRGAYPLILWSLAGQRTYCLEGTIITLGATVQWLRDVLGIIPSLEQSAAVAAESADNGGVWFVPALQGLGTPHMQTDVRASFGGLSRATNRSQIVRALFEGIAFRSREVFETLIEDAAIGQPERLRIDGGAASNDFLLQQAANAVGIPVERPACVQASALGAAYLAGLATGVWSDVDTLARTWRSGGVFEPQWNSDERDARYRQWQRAVDAVRTLPAQS